VAIFVGQEERPREGFDDLDGRRDDAPLFESGKVIDGDVGQFGQFLTAQTS
jgi:hypothetical protein